MRSIPLPLSRPRLRGAARRARSSDGTGTKTSKFAFGPKAASVCSCTMDLDDLISQLDKEDLNQARRMTPSQKLRAGGDLFDDACRWTLAGIRNQHPEFTPEQALNELRRRIAREEEAEERPS